MTTSVEERFNVIVKEILGNGKELLPETKIADDLNGDSLDVIEIVMAAEEEFGIAIPDEEAEKFVTIADACNFIKEQMKGD